MAKDGVLRNRGDDEARRARSLDAWILRWLGRELHDEHRARPQFDRPLLRNLRWAGSGYTRPNCSGVVDVPNMVSSQSAVPKSAMVTTQQHQSSAERAATGNEQCRDEQEDIPREF